MQNRLKYDEKDSSFGYAIAIFSPLVLTLVYSLICIFISMSSKEIADTFSGHVATSVVVTIFGYLFYALFLFIYHKKTKTNMISALNLKSKISVRNTIIAVALALVTLFGFLFLVNFLTDALKLTGYKVDTSMPFPLDNFGWLLANVLVLAVLPAIFEEILYRGMLLNGLRKFGEWFAILISALFFALAHGSPVQFVYQFVLGIVFGLIVVKTGSVVLSALTHFINNFTVILISYLETTSGVEVVEKTVFDYSATQIILAFLFAILAGGFIYLLVKGFHKNQNEQLYYKEENAQFDNNAKILFFVTIVSSVVIWVASLF